MEMLATTFRYERNPNKTRNFPHAYEGIYYKSAKRRTLGEDGRNDEEEIKHQCSILCYPDERHAIAQINLSSHMKYALKVLYINNTDSEVVNVIYPFFGETMSQWFKTVMDADYALPENMEYAEWMRTEVMPKIGELWKLLHEMKEKNIRISDRWCEDIGLSMPLIRKEPKLLNLRDGEFVSGEVKLLPRLLNLEEGLNNEKDYAKIVFDEILKKGEGRYELPEKFRVALDFWNNAKNNEETITSLNYWLCCKHPILYDPADKKRFLLLINDIIFSYGLKGWLNGEFDWMSFESQIRGVKKQQNKNAYRQILQYRAGRSRGKFEEPLTYSAGSDIVRFTRNALMHFEENYKRGNNNTTWHRCLNDHKREIVEILDDELNVCSTHYAIARTIITEDPPEKYTEEGWKKCQAKEWEILKQPYLEVQAKAQAKVNAEAMAEAETVAKVKAEAGEEAEAEAEAAKVISQAYQPMQLKLRKSSNNWMEATKFIRFYQPLSLCVNQPDCWMEATKIKAAYQENDPKLDEREFLTKEGGKEDLRPDWMKFKDIKKKYNANRPLELLTNMSGWMELKEIFQPPQLLVENDSDICWMEATDILKRDKPPRLYTKEGWKLSWMELVEIKNKVDQPPDLELHTREGRSKGWKKLEEIKNETNQQLELRTMEEDWKNIEDIIKSDQPPSLWVKKVRDKGRDNSRDKGQDEYYWMEAFEDKRPAAEFITKRNWLNARAELENFFNSLK